MVISTADCDPTSRQWLRDGFGAVVAFPILFLSGSGRMSLLDLIAETLG